MDMNKFEYLPVDILFEIFSYLSPINILQSFSSLNKRFSRIVIRDYLWHINIDGNSMTLSMFNNFCQNVLKLIGTRVISLRITLSNAIGGWSLISSSMQSYRITLLQRLHLIDIKPHEFDKLLCNRLIKHLHTLIVDVTNDRSSFYCEAVEGTYLTKVCSCLSNLTICRLPFNYCPGSRKQCPVPLMILPNLCNTNHLRTLTIGMNTPLFIECLLKCIPFIENLSFCVYNGDIYNNYTNSNVITLPSAIDGRLLRYLSRLKIDCSNKISFHRIINLLSSVFGQLTHLSLKLETYTSLSDPLIITGDTIQQLCISRLKPLSTYALNLSFHVIHDLQEKFVFKSFVDAPFTNRKQPRIIICEDLIHSNSYLNEHQFFVYTLPYNDTKINNYFIPGNIHTISQGSIGGLDLFSHINELFLISSEIKHFISVVLNSTRLSIFWPVLTKLTIYDENMINTGELKAMLELAPSIHTLILIGAKGILFNDIVCNKENLASTINGKIRSFEMYNSTLTLFNAENICTLLVNQLFNLKTLSFSIFNYYNEQHRNSLGIIDGENESTKRILNLIGLFINHLELISLNIYFPQWIPNYPSYFPHGIRRELHQYIINRPYRLQCSRNKIQIWF